MRLYHARTECVAALARHVHMSSNRQKHGLASATVSQHRGAPEPESLNLRSHLHVAVGTGAAVRAPQHLLDRREQPLHILLGDEDVE
jgi:hypothetical protein